MITQQEYIQLKAFVRNDGLWIGLLLTVTIACSIGSMFAPSLQFMALGGMVLTPVVAANRVRYYRDFVVMKRVSFKRAWGYTFLSFGYASLIVAMLTYLYFQFLDHGMVMGQFTKMMQMPEMETVIKAYGMTKKQMMDELAYMSSIRPIDLALSAVSNILLLGGFLGFIIAAFTRREPRNIQR